tara:strand:+ start:179 stop:526 length:348 start_codon:yes stop_codon:yes gene_type:complete
MTSNYEEYIDIKPPPPYNEKKYDDIENKLIEKLKNRISSDISQINNIYDLQIEDLKKNKMFELDSINKKYNNIFKNVNVVRNKEIKKYKEKAEHSINDIISNLNKKQKKSFWNFF